MNGFVVRTAQPKASLLKVQMKTNSNTGSTFQWETSCSVTGAGFSLIERVNHFVSAKWT